MHRFMHTFILPFISYTLALAFILFALFHHQHGHSHHLEEMNSCSHLFGSKIYMDRKIIFEVSITHTYTLFTHNTTNSPPRGDLK